MKAIFLTRGYITLVDDEDYEFLMQWKWYAGGPGSTPYAIRNTTIDGKQKMVQMHRVLMNAPKGMVVDHIDNQGLNNQKSNLRVCTQSQNCRNTPKSLKAMRSTGSPYKGVSMQIYMSGDIKYKAQFKGKNLGVYDSEEVAARVVDKAMQELYGEFAYLNFK
jgi:hypothetical protein